MRDGGSWAPMRRDDGEHPISFARLSRNGTSLYLRAPPGHRRRYPPARPPATWCEFARAPKTRATDTRTFRDDAGRPKPRAALPCP